MIEEGEEEFEDTWFNVIRETRSIGEERKYRREAPLGMWKLRCVCR